MATVPTGILAITCVSHTPMIAVMHTTHSRGAPMSEVICFHLITEPNGYLSNWYHSRFVLDGNQYCCAEQYLMHAKALTFGDSDRAEQVMRMNDPAQMQAIGRAVEGYDEDVWAGMRQVVAFRALKAKYSQNVILRERLLATGDAVLAECAIKDRTWGIGLGMHAPARLCPSKWPGRNLLGYTLMMVRDQLREEFAGAERKMPLLHAFAKRLKYAAKQASEKGVIYSISAEEMKSLGLEMDGGESFIETCGIQPGDLRALELKYEQIDDPLVLGNAIFSEWRYYSHWANYAMSEDNVRWFELAAKRLGEITREEAGNQ